MGTNDIEWSDKFSTDIVSVDRQHQELLYLSQNLLEVLSDESTSLKEKQDVFQDLVAHALAHFEYEERVMRNIHYPGLARHLREHDDLRREINAMTDMVLQGEGLEDWKGLVSMVQVWVLRHIVSSDTRIREHIQREVDDDFDIDLT